ncbi:hypothetical protein [Streptomyces sp. NPDC005799]|uniref:enoyl-CoA hydratase/isomerase family protein n=1 Tax=Streptomyces sp. NPDC005799 TaxID=3154678 RepID=UPI0033D777AE
MTSSWAWSAAAPPWSPPSTARPWASGAASWPSATSTWPLHTSLLPAKEYALTDARIPAEKAVALGPANHVAADPLAEATACAKRIAGLPRQAAESTKRVLNTHLERAVLATLDYATSAEEQSFQTDDFRDTPARLTGK